MNSARSAGLAVGFAAAAVTVMGVTLASDAALAEADFYAGKTIAITTYGAPGDSYDVYMRLFTRHFGRHLPGNPRFTATNQTGAGGLIAANHLARVAPRDGTFLTVASQGLLMFEATGQKGLATSIGNFNWIGSFTQSNNVTVTWHTAPTKTLADAYKREVTLGASGAAGGSVLGPALYNAVLGTKFKVIYGYPGGGHIILAMKRGEIEGRGNNTWAGYKATMPNEVRDGLLNVLIQTGLRKDRELPHVPLFLDLVKGDPEREPIAMFMSRSVSIARPVAAPPGVPPERVQLLRRAFDATMKDPEYLAEASKLHVEIDPLTGEQVQDVVTRVLATPAPVIERIKAMQAAKN